MYGDCERICTYYVFMHVCVMCVCMSGCAESEIATASGVCGVSRKWHTNLVCAGKYTSSDCAFFRVR